MGYTETALDKQFKQRLTGAVILVVLIVAFVPALLTGPRQSTSGPPPIEQEGPPLRSYTIDLTEAGRAPSGAMSAPEPDEPVRRAEPAAAPDVKPAEPAQPAEPAAVPAAKPGEPATEPAEPASAPAAERATPAAPRVEAGYAVQVGSFENKANANRLAGELKRQGFDAFVAASPAPRRLYRVRVGPVADRPAAERLATRLASFKRPGRVVAHP